MPHFENYHQVNTGYWFEFWNTVKLIEKLCSAEQSGTPCNPFKETSLHENMTKFEQWLNLEDFVEFKRSNCLFTEFWGFSLNLNHSKTLNHWKLFVLIYHLRNCQTDQNYQLSVNYFYLIRGHHSFLRNKKSQVPAHLIFTTDVHVCLSWYLWRKVCYSAASHQSSHQTDWKVCEHCSEGCPPAHTYTLTHTMMRGIKTYKHTERKPSHKHPFIKIGTGF